MVAIYIPVLQSVAPVYSHVAKSYDLDYKTTFILRALHACNEAKDNHITCLGTAVSYHRRCRNHLHKWTAVLAEMIEAAEDGTLYFEDLKLCAVKWSAGLSCYLHGRQKGVAMAALGAIAVYRQSFPGNVVLPRVQRLESPLEMLSSAVDRYAETSLPLGKRHKALEWKAKERNDSRALLGESVQQEIAVERLLQLRRIEKVLLSIEKAILLLCENFALLLESQELLYEAISLLAEEQELLLSEQ